MLQNKIQVCRKSLLRLLKQKALKRGRIVLSSGKVSDYYLDGRLITLTSQGAFWAASIILDLIKDKKITAVGGPTLGADPIVGAILALAAKRKKRISGFIVRKSPKKHGTCRLIEGPAVKKKARVVLVDDVATTGGSLVEAKMVLSGLDIDVDCAIVIIDREEGASQNLAKVHCPLISIFKKEDFV